MPVEDFVLAWSASLERHFPRYLAGEISYQEQRRARIREVVDPTLSDVSADKLFAEFVEAYEAGWSLFADVHSCLDGLSAHRLGIISNGQGSQQRRKLAWTGIAERFHCIAISEECGCAKPAPEIFRRACAMLDVPPNEAIYVGDRYDIDAEAARQAGLFGVWLDRRGRTAAHHRAPIIRTLDDLPRLLGSAEMV